MVRPSQLISRLAVSTSLTSMHAQDHHPSVQLPPLPSHPNLDSRTDLSPNLASPTTACFISSLLGGAAASVEMEIYSQVRSRSLPDSTSRTGPSADPAARRTQTACRRVAARDGVLDLLGALAEGGNGWTEACRSDPAVQRETTRISASSSLLSLSRSRHQRIQLMLSCASQSRLSCSSPAL